jgi:flavin reductase (DIM6/NTAB) family NADH-FMN oxidoreductase RutF
MKILSVDPSEISIPEMQGYLLGAVAPRPIAFASTINKEGVVNLSPFSFFNCFGANPPILIFSPSRRVRDNTQKHTLLNARETGEVVINIVNHAIVGQMSLSSTEYGEGVNEFTKSGLTETPSVKVAPPRVEEAPAAFECKVNDIIELGDQGGAGNLIICEVVMAHFKEDILDENGKIDPYALDAVSRMGGDWYCRAQGEALFQWPKPIAGKGMGVDRLPESIRNSAVLSGNDLSQLANHENMPKKEQVIEFRTDNRVREILDQYGNDPLELNQQLHRIAAKFLEDGEAEKAWLALLTADDGRPTTDD